MHDWRESEALHRFSVIREAADRGLNKRERGQLVKALTDRLHQGPAGELKTISRSTIERWISAYRKGGFEALKPKPRRIEPRTPAHILDKAADLRREAPDRTGAQIAEILARLHGSEAPAIRTVERHLERRGLRREDLRGQPKALGRFEADHPNEIWVADAMHGPLVDHQGRARKAILYALMDDHSRFLVGARFTAQETELRLEPVLRGALESRGVPGLLYVDNGAPFASAQLQRICAVLGIRLAHSRPGRPEGRGKIERFFRTLRSRFLVEVKQRERMDLAELNRLLVAWLERFYHLVIHSETGHSPAERFTAADPRIPTAAALREAFLWPHKRTVTKTATVSLEGNRYEVTPELCGRQVELLYDPFDLTEVEVRFQGNAFGKATPHTVGRHVHPRAESHVADEAAPKTGIDYLQILKAEHEERLGQEGIAYRHLENKENR